MGVMIFSVPPAFDKIMAELNALEGEITSRLGLALEAWCASERRFQQKDR